MSNRSHLFVACCRSTVPQEAIFHPNTDCRERKLVLASAFRRRFQTPLSAPPSFHGKLRSDHLHAEAAAPGGSTMKAYATQSIRNVGIAGHGDTGKTQLVSSLLYTAGMTTRLGEV